MDSDILARVPFLTSAAQAIADPAMAVLSVAYHGADATALTAFASGIVSLSPDEAKKYYEYGLCSSNRRLPCPPQRAVTRRASIGDGMRSNLAL